MRKYLISLFILLGLLGINTIHAWNVTLPDGTVAPMPTALQWNGSATTPTTWSTPTAGWPTKVIVTEKVPWANCKCYVGGNAGGEDCPTGTKVEDRKYICEVDKWLVAFQKMFAQIVRWVVNIVMLLGVLAIVWAGILWAWGSESEEQTKKAKWWVINIIIGLAILFTFRYILGFLAPWIFK
jgi:hypothetical protein